MYHLLVSLRMQALSHALVVLAGLHGDVLVSSFIVALTSPPDARYSPLGPRAPPNSPASPSSFDAVHALVLPVTSDAVATKVSQAQPLHPKP